jgi:hypothetical protein
VRSLVRLKFGRSERPRRGGRGYHGHLATNQIGGQRRQSIVVSLRPAVFDRHVPTLDIAGFACAAAKSPLGLQSCGQNYERGPLGIIICHVHVLMHRSTACGFSSKRTL